MKPSTRITNAKHYTFTAIGIVSLIVFFVFAATFWNSIRSSEKDKGLPKPLRAMHELNAKVFGNVFSNNHLAKEFPLTSAVKKPRVNGLLGLKSELDTISWRLNVVRSKGDTLRLTLGDIQNLPKTEIVFDFKCIEGWSQVTHWGGVKFSDFVQAYHLEKIISDQSIEYAGLVTPDGKYYVGIDKASMMHPQTLLCYEMNGNPLPLDQGYPLRLIIPVKYGIKHLKRIGTISFSHDKPKDYWAEQGYDYYSGL